MKYLTLIGAVLLVLGGVQLTSSEAQAVNGESHVSGERRIFHGATREAPNGLVYKISEDHPTKLFFVCRISYANGSLVRFKPYFGAKPDFSEKPIGIDWRAAFPHEIEPSGCALVEGRHEFIVLDGAGRRGNSGMMVEVLVSQVSVN